MANPRDKITTNTSYTTTIVRHHSHYGYVPECSYDYTPAVADKSVGIGGERLETYIIQEWNGLVGLWVLLGV